MKRITSVMKLVAEFDVDLARIVVMKSAEGQAVVNQKMTVRNVQCIYGDREFLAEVLAQRKIDRGVSRKVWVRELSVGRSIRECRAVVDIRRREQSPWKVCIETYIQRVSLIVIKGGKSGLRLAA